MEFCWMFMAITYEATSFWKAAQPAWISRWKRNVMKQMGFLALKNHIHPEAQLNKLRLSIQTWADDA